MDSIREFVKDKSVLFVGNSVEIMEHNLAKFIDGFDIVVRFGRAISTNKRQQKCVGKKCDIWITGQFRAPEYHKNKKEFTTGKYKNTKILVNRCRGNFKLRNWVLENRLPKDFPAYTEMYSDSFKYPGEWTESWESYLKYKDHLIREIRIWMNRYESIVETGKLEELANSLHENYFSCNGLRKVLFNGQ